MKTIKLFNVLFFSFLAIFFSCSSDDDGGTDNAPLTVVSVTDAMLEGNWRISDYNDSGEDETSDFAGFNFEFFDDGSVRANNGTMTLDGIWSVTVSSSDENDSVLDFNLFFAVAEDHDFDDLNDNWDIMASSNTSLSLTDVSGGDASIDNLVFVKN